MQWRRISARNSCFRYGLDNDFTAGTNFPPQKSFTLRSQLGMTDTEINAVSSGRPRSHSTCASVRTGIDWHCQGNLSVTLGFQSSVNGGKD